ncbi:acetyl-CoA synthetase-like protein [Polychaeton citri CBS 116435]|uniref:Acetyl-CoA synthetase-like protein n=1 Tax=Polychaeton citri CBS 116435 TaxID=1314669 RepID=A0A9P4QCQ3_9PEZI|nr:acetyl-CoA synthetase-like protein [Polychaeton citri CBS 116435]
MVVFRSPHPRLDVPINLTTWQWAFESVDSPLHSRNDNHTAGSGEDHVGAYVNADTGQRLDFHAVKRIAESLSICLIHSYGFQAGDTVSLLSGNSVWYPAVVWATVRIGGRVNGASPAYSVQEMAHALKTAETKFLFTVPGSLNIAAKACETIGLSKKCIFLLEGDVRGHRSVQDLVREGDYMEYAPPFQIPQDMTNKDVCGYLNFSSGTTGLPKAVMLSHHNIIAQCHQLRQLQVVTSGERYKILAVMPLFHITGLVRFVHYPVLLDGDCIMLPTFNMIRMLDSVLKYRIEELILVPPILVRITKDPEVKPYLPELRKTVKRWSSGSAPIAPEVIKALQELFPASGFRQGYGATESTACISCHPPSHYDYRYATAAGVLCANTIAKVMNLEDQEESTPYHARRELAVGETGEIWARGPQIAMGYLSNPKATAETFHVDPDESDNQKDGYRWFHTGDVGHIDTDGLIYIEDRIKEMIKVKGQQVAPAELEDCLLGHEAVADCAVISTRDDYAGERPKAYVVLKPGFGALAGGGWEPNEARRTGKVVTMEDVGKALLEHVREVKVRYKWVKEIEFVDIIPKSPTGKLLRRILKVRDGDQKRSRGVVVRDDGVRARL